MFPRVFSSPRRKDSETLELNAPETRRRMDADPMFRVEKTLRDPLAERWSFGQLRFLKKKGGFL